MSKTLLSTGRRFAAVAALVLAACACVAATMLGATPAYATESGPVYRLYQPATSEHLYTTDAYEARVLYEMEGWGYEGVSWNAPSSGTPVYRLYNSELGSHLYTTDENEMNELVANYGWTADFDGSPIFLSGGTVNVYRLYNEDLNGLHHWTTNENEYNVLPDYGWTQESVGFYAESNGLTYTRTHYYPEAMNSGWAYDSDGLLRYYIDGTPQLLWVIAPSPDDPNDIERYYVDPVTRCVTTGWFDVDGYTYYGTDNYGAVARNTYMQNPFNEWVEFDNDGVCTHAATVAEMEAEAQNHESETEWLILVNTTTDFLGVFHINGTVWEPYEYWRVSCGASDSSTVLGEYSITGRGASFDGTKDDGTAYTCYWYTQFYGNYLFHSILYYQGTMEEYDPTIGANVSDGCVRMDIDHAEWIYDYIPDGTYVYIYE